MEQIRNTMPNMIYPKPPTPAPMMPKKKSHPWVIMLVVLAVLALVYFYAKQKNAPFSEEQKADLLKEFNDSNTVTITEEEKSNIVNDLSAGNSGSNISDEEKQKILE